MSDRIDNVSVSKTANIFFDGKCVSHSVYFPDGSRKTVGVVMPHSQLTFHVGTSELMEISSGTCKVRIAGESVFRDYPAGSHFRVPANSSFEIRTGTEAVHYVCSFGVD